MIINSATFNSSPLNSGLPADPLRDAAVFSDAISGLWAATAVDSVTVVSAISADFAADPLIETVIIADVSSGVQVITGASLSDIATLADTLSAIVITTTVDTISVVDTLSANVGAVVLSDMAVLSDSASGDLAVQATATDTVAFSDALDYGWVALPLTDTLALTATSSGNLALAAVGLADVAALTDTLTGVLEYSITLTDTVSVSDVLTTPTFALVAVPLLSTLRLTDFLIVTEQQVTVINATTNAASSYEFPFVVQGLGQFRGILYLACADGLYALDAAEDETGAVVWTLATGYSNLGDDRIKRIRDINVQGRTEGDLTLTVTTGRSGTKRDDSFRILPALTRHAYRDGVIKIGRGLQSVYWGFTLNGEGPTEINEVRLAIEPLGRRR